MCQLVITAAWRQYRYHDSVSHYNIHADLLPLRKRAMRAYISRELMREVAHTWRVTSASGAWRCGRFGV